MVVLTDLCYHHYIDCSSSCYKRSRPNRNSIHVVIIVVLLLSLFTFSDYIYHNNYNSHGYFVAIAFPIAIRNSYPSTFYHHSKLTMKRIHSHHIHYHSLQNLFHTSSSYSSRRRMITSCYYHKNGNIGSGRNNNYDPLHHRIDRCVSSSTTTGTNHSNKKKTTTWRKAIHVSDEVPISKTTTSNVNNNNNEHLQFIDTPLGKNGIHLLDGLDHYTVYATDDQHPLSVYGIQSDWIGQPNGNNHDNDGTTSTNTPSKIRRKPILLLHGRTWSSVPVYHLLGGPFQQSLVMSSSSSSTDQIQQHESRSLMEALLQKGLQPYCMDFRGFGGTHMDHTKSVEPYRCVQDAESVLQWIYEKHALHNATTETQDQAKNGDIQSTTTTIDETAIPALLGWSQGALVAQLVAQRNHIIHHHHPTTTTTAMTKQQPILSKLILYGSIYDPLVRYPREPLYVSNPSNKTIAQQNTFDAAIEDFTVEGTIPPEPARLFAEAALLSDPIKVVWKNLYQFNNCDPARVHVPCLVIAGDQDPYAPLHVQQELFCNLARASDRTWSILSGSDHACHLLDGRDRLINTVVSFVMNGKRTEPRF